MEVDDPHVGDVEHSGVVAHRVMLVDLGAVIHRHVPAAEIHHARACGAVHRMQGGLFEHLFSRVLEQRKAGTVTPSRPVCPFT